MDIFLHPHVKITSSKSKERTHQMHSISSTTDSFSVGWGLSAARPTSISSITPNSRRNRARSFVSKLYRFGAGFGLLIYFMLRFGQWLKDLNVFNFFHIFIHVKEIVEVTIFEHGVSFL